MKYSKSSLHMCFLPPSKKSILTIFNSTSWQDFQDTASIQKRVSQAEAEEASDVGEDRERSVDLVALCHFNRWVKNNLESRP